MEIVGLIGGLSGLVSIIVVIWKIGFQFGRLLKEVDRLGEDYKQLEERLAKVESVCDRTTVLETKIELFWKFVEQKMSGFLKSPHTPRFDTLLDKFAERKLTLNEAIELRDELHLDEQESKNNGIRDMIRTFVAVRLEQIIQELSDREEH